MLTVIMNSRMHWTCFLADGCVYRNIHNIKMEPLALRTFRQTHGYCELMQKIGLKL